LTATSELSRQALTVGGRGLTETPRPPVHHWLARTARNEYFLAALVMAALVGVFFNPVFRYNATFSAVANMQRHMYPWQDPAVPEASLPPGVVQADQAEFIHPRQEFVDDTLKQEHQFPLWEPLTFAGQPFFAANGSRLAYPPYLVLSWLLSPALTQDLYLMFHLFLAGLTMFALLKSLGARFGGAMLAGVSWAFSSYVMAWALFGAIPAVAALLPLAVLLVRRAHDRRSWRVLLLASAVLALLFLGTSAELAFLSYLLVFGYAAGLSLWHLATGWRPMTGLQRVAVLAAPAALMVVALLIAGVGVIPFLDLSSQSSRVASPYSLLVQAWATQPSHFLRAFAPPDLPVTVTTLINQQVFVGTVTAMLGVVGFFLRRPGAAFARCVVVLMFLYLLRTPVTWASYHLVPGMKGLTGFGRSLFLWDFALAMLGGMGLDAVLRAIRTQGGVFAPAAPVGAEPAAGRARRDGTVPAGGGRTSAAENRRRTLSAVVAGACILTTGVQLLWYGRHVNPPFQSRDSQFLYPPRPATEAVRAELARTPGGGRVMPVDRYAAATRPDLWARALPGAIGTALGLAVAGGYETLLPPRTQTLWRVIQGDSVEVALSPPVSSYYTRFFPGVVRTELLARMGIAAVITPPEVPDSVSLTPENVPPGQLQRVYMATDASVYRVQNALPRAFVTTGVSWAPTSEAALRKFTDPRFDAAAQVILEGRPASSDAASSGVGSRGSVEWKKNTPNEIRLSVSTSRPGWLVVLDSWDAGWKATVAGRSVDVRRADYGFRAVPVPAGTSSVTFSYRPRPVIVGAAVSSLTLAAIGLLLLLPSRGSRPSGSETSGDRRPSRRRRRRVSTGARDDRWTPAALEHRGD
jgi:hypothetical protein